MINILYFQGICLQQINSTLFNLQHHRRFGNRVKFLNIAIPVSNSSLLTSQKSLPLGFLDTQQSLLSQ